MIQKLKNYEMLLKWKFGVEKKMLLPKNMKVLHAGAGARGRPPHAGAPAADSNPYPELRLEFLATAAGIWPRLVPI